MNIVLSKTALAALDRYRAERKIRTRAKAIETVLLEVAPDDELSPSSAKKLKARLSAPNRTVHSLSETMLQHTSQVKPIKLSRAERKILDERIAEAKAGHAVPASVVWEELQERIRQVF